MEPLYTPKQRTSVVVAGGRDFIPNRNHMNWLISIIQSLNADEIVSGGAKGADHFGELICEKLNLKLIVFKAYWDKYGKRAGHLRNEQMARYGTHVILFEGGRGTDNMRMNAHKYKLPLYEYKDSK